MKIQQIGSLTGRAAGFLADVIRWNPLFQFMEFRPEPSYFTTTPDKSAFSNSAARLENAPVQKDAQTPSPSGVNIALYDREVAIDEVRVRDAKIAGANVGLKTFSDRQLRAVIKKLSSEVQDDMIAGTGIAPKMLGLAGFVKDANAAGQTAALSFTTAEQAAMNENVNLKLDNPDDEKTFYELLMRKIADVPGANILICNTKLLGRMTMIAKRFGAAGESVNSFGVPISTFQQIPICALPTSSVSQTEPDGVNNDCTSLYIVRAAEELGVCFGTNTGFYFKDFPDYETYPQGVARVGFYENLIVESTDALKRLSRIRL